MGEIIDDILQNVSLVEVVSEYVLLKKRGKNYLGLCPFHIEKTPSFNVNPEKNLYYCFGCGAGGNLFNFLMAIENISFQEALKIAAQRAGISLQTTDTHSYRRQKQKRESLFRAYNLAARYYQHILFKTEIGRSGRKYLQERGYSLDYARKMGLGMAPPGWDHLFKFLSKKGFSGGFLAEGGLVVKRSSGVGYYDRFRDRLMFTIYNNRNQPLAFGGRLINEVDNQPKYLNSPETPLFDKGRNLYGLNWASAAIRKQDSVLIFEGYTDVLTGHMYGINNCVAPLGTALTQGQARLIKRYSANAYIGYDADVAGQAATLRSLDVLLKEGLNVYIIDIEANEDPDSFIKRKGAEHFSKIARAGKPYAQYLIDRLISKYDSQGSAGRVEAGKGCLEILKKIDDAIEREIYLQYAAEKLGLAVEILKSELTGYPVQKSKNKDKKPAGWNTNHNRVEISELGLEERILAGLLKNNNYKDFFLDISPSDFTKTINRELAEMLAMGVGSKELFLAGNEKMSAHLAQLHLMDTVDSVDTLIKEFKKMQLNTKKYNILTQLRKSNSLDINSLNRKLFLYREILKEERGLEKEGQCESKKE